MAVGDETYIHGDANRDGSLRTVVVAAIGSAGLPEIELQVRSGGQWKRVEGVGVYPGTAGHEVTAMWRGTQAEYDALTPDSTTLYVIVE